MTTLQSRPSLFERCLRAVVARFPAWLGASAAGLLVMGMLTAGQSVARWVERSAPGSAEAGSRAELLHLLPAMGAAILVGALVWVVQRHRLAGAAAARSSEQQVGSEQRRLEAMVRSLPLGVFFADGQGRPFAYNAQMERITGRPNGEMLGERWVQSIHPDDRERVVSSWQSAAKAGDPFESEHRFLRPDGAARWVRVLAQAQRDGTGITGFVGTIEDVHENRVSAERLTAFTEELVAANRAIAAQADELRRKGVELEAARAAAEQANIAKSSFLAKMSHEIRTPMTAIMGFGDTLLDPAQSAEERAEAVHTIRRAGTHLLGLINEILDLSKIESGAMSTERIGCSLPEILHDVDALMRVGAVEKGVGLSVEYVTALPAVIQSDPMRVRQIITNLVGNAVKFTEQGAVRVMARLDDATEAGAEPSVVIEVHDTGIGMSPEQMGRLFRPFAQADDSMSRRFGGTGLGLTITKRLVEILGGSLSVSSEPGMGSTFTVRLPTGPLDGVDLVSRPLEPASSSVRPGMGLTAASRLAGLSVLVAEDGPDNQRLITMLLRKAGATVSLVDNGQSAVEAALEARAAGKPFDVILMDMQMPVLDGYSATSSLRAQGYQDPILALTAHAMAGDEDRCKTAGCDAYYTKPVNRETLVGACHLWAQRAQRLAA